jgi:hypothetical protein
MERRFAERCSGIRGEIFLRSDAPRSDGGMLRSDAPRSDGGMLRSDAPRSDGGYCGAMLRAPCELSAQADQAHEFVGLRVGFGHPFDDSLRVG